MSTAEIGQNTTNILKLLFFTMNLHLVTTNQLSTYRKLNFPLKSNIFCLLTSINAKNIQTDQSIPRFLLLCLKSNDPQTFKSGICKNPFLYCVCYWYNLLRWIFLFYVITFQENLSLLWGYFKRHVAACFEASVLKEVRILCVISPQVMLIPKFQNEADYAFDFSLQMEFLFIKDICIYKLKTSVEACFLWHVLTFQQIVWIKWEQEYMTDYIPWRYGIQNIYQN